MKGKTITLMNKILDYSEKYEITIQHWPGYKTIYVAKDGVDLISYGDYGLDEVLEKVTAYLDRINKKS